MSWNPLRLEDGPLIREYLQTKCYAYSQCNFTTMYLWEKMTGAKWQIIEDCLCISMNVRGCTFASFPVGNGDVHGAIEHLRNEFSGCLFFGMLTNEMLAQMQQWYSNLIVTDRRDSYDYVYLREKLVTLSGKKLHGKRNHINKFKSLYSYEYHPFSKEFAKECLVLEQNWLNTKADMDDFSRECEYDAVRKSIEDFDALGCKGGVLTVDSKVIAFTIGEMLTPDTALIHMEKADATYQGAYPMINQQFCEHEFQDAVYIDREEDMGLESLRKAKLSYDPEKLIEVQTVVIGT
ncbi:MAG: DUF2156 domain-containing protein [Ruminococcaceae bacterium]|nr:DUF2156 domain-containing protein [Oscillospiraceae bacterium]